MLPVGLLFANIAAAVDLVYNKYVLSRIKVPFRAFLVYVFLFAFLFSAVLFPFWGSFNISKLTAYYLLIFLAMVALAVSHNLLLQRALLREKVDEIELYFLLTPITTILFASFILPGEFNDKVFISAIVGASALILAHIKRKHLSFDKYTPLLFLYLIFASLEAVIIKILLEVLPPVTLHMFRCALVFIIYALSFGFTHKYFRSTDLKFLIFIAFLWVVCNVFIYQGYEALGVVETTLILLISPILVYIFAYIFFDEHIKKRQIVATLLIIAAIVYSVY